MNGLDIIKARAFGASGGGSGGSGGGSELLNSLIDRSITEIKSDALSVGNYAFYGCTSLTTADFPVVTSIGNNAFYGCTSLTTADFPVATSIGSYAFQACNSLTAFTLRNASLCNLSAQNAFTSTPIASGTGYIYVPSALVDTYKTATNWSTFAAQFRALEDYTVDGTIYGEMDWAKMAA